MSRAQSILHAVVARPGMSPREIGDALGLNWKSSVGVVCATLQQLTKAGKLEFKGAMRARRYYATSDALVDRRFRTRAKAAKAAKPKPARARKAAAPKSASRIRLGPPKPTAAQQVQVVPKRPASNAATASKPFETVDSFLARGGRIQRLSHGASANPLRITRADIDAANWRRREQRIKSQ